AKRSASTFAQRRRGSAAMHWTGGGCKRSRKNPLPMCRVTHDNALVRSRNVGIRARDRLPVPTVSWWLPGIGAWCWRLGSSGHTSLQEEDVRPDRLSQLRQGIRAVSRPLLDHRSDTGHKVGSSGAKVKETKTFQITDPDHLIGLGRVMGLLQAIEAIKSACIEIKLPGIGVARHAVIAEEAQARVQLMQDNLRTAFSELGSLEGYSISCTGRGVITLEPDDSSESESDG